MRTFLLRATAALGVGVVVLAAGPRAHGCQCVRADVIVHRTNQADYPVVTDGQCQVPTPFGGVVNEDKDVFWGQTQTGVPSGVYLDLWVPFP